MPARAFARPLLALLLLCLAGAAAAAGEARTVTDMAGRTVALPPAGQIRRIATPDGTPGVNAFVFLFGKGGALVNGLPNFIRSQPARWRLQTLAAPQLAELPAVSEPPGWAANLETLLSLRPDLVFAVEAGNIRALESKGFRTVAVTWRNAESIRASVELMGKVFDQPARARDYGAYLDAVLAYIDKRLRASPAKPRPKAVYLRLESLTSPMRPTAGWLIEHAGGMPVPEKTAGIDTLQLSPEQLLADNPDVIVVWSREEAEKAYRDPRLRRLAAVKQRRVFPIPRGFMPWTHYTPELAPSLLWMARTLYPSRFADLDLVRETIRFYERFYGVTLSADEARELLDGAP